VTMDMTEEAVDPNRALQERQLSFKLADSFMFTSFDGSWNLRYHSRIPRTDPVTQEVSYHYRTLLTYSVYVRPKGPVPVIALEWRIKEDIPTNLEGMKIASERVSAARRNSNSNMKTNMNTNGSNGNMSGRGLTSGSRVWGTDETLGLYMAKGRRGVNQS
jgi:Polyketide cyclase / dehydrase and lipid transport